MFDRLFGNFEEKREEIQEKLEAILLETEVGHGAITVKGNARRQILEINIDKSKLDPNDTDQLQDLLLTAINEIIVMATEAEAEESQKMLKDMMPPGLGGLSNLFN